ncbi:rab3 GTPase-activating protein catalytic subunit-like isoform X1 [Cucurbita pepo subsp. pepo]|uniref:rab3 GTPase-activating protein catalytic subunit-like isoform X1 n=1 Tax=Cucurbita pepo subsp. pepo TaxID=3664 RepID=UPI000C9DA049|nr:rab3 GTPase-activating protein catalytic subunit-like isoform X1 [Cucurbita pepo subsp. pepo]XP_023521288.1 rab3 GTPase-activating protein catalytic subunit-like isoform X1 [Cucurbita pepo subsp. pepo]
MSVPFYDENLYMLNMKNDIEAKNAEIIPSVESFLATDKASIPSLSVIKQLAIAIEAGKKSKSVKSLLASSAGSSSAKGKPGLNLSTVRALVLREKEEKISTTFRHDERIQSLIRSLFDAGGDFLKRSITSGSEGTIAASLPRDIHGAPPDSLLVKISEVIGSFRSLRKMTLFWCRIVDEMRRFWSEEQYIPGIPIDEIPDLNSCLLYQRFQVINCCLSRKRRHEIASDSLDVVLRVASSNTESGTSEVTVPANSLLYARLNNGELALRLGADCPFSNLTMLETGEKVYSPVTQEGPLLTEDVIKETEEFVLRTGSVGAGCSQLLSDMQAFKAANPGCILEDFVRWHSPPDWTEPEPSNGSVHSSIASDSRGQLSSRMQKEGNLWRELWDTSKAVPAVKQTPLFDEDLVVEGILTDLEDLPTTELYGPLFLSLLGLGFVMAEAKLAEDNNLSKLFYECKDYVVATCQGSSWNNKVDDICQVYETVETMMVNPDEILKAMKQAEESNMTTSVLKRRFKKLSLNLVGKDEQTKKSSPRNANSDERLSSSTQPFSSFFDSKSSLFAKKPPKPESTSATPVENGWTLV